MQTNLLDEKRFLATFAAPMRNVTAESANVIDIWPYVASIPVHDFRGHTIFDQFVEYVYRDATGRYDHVMVMTRSANVYVVIVVDCLWDGVHGHHLLDLNEKFGVSPGP